MLCWLKVMRETGYLVSDLEDGFFNGFFDFFNGFLKLGMTLAEGLSYVAFVMLR